MFIAVLFAWGVFGEVTSGAMATGVWPGEVGKDIRHVKEGRLVWGGGRGLWWQARGRRQVKGQPDPGVKGKNSK